jgi:signal transduction histidine kinase
MVREASLRRRIVQACLLLTAVVCAVYALLLLAGVHALEDKLLDTHLVESAPDLIRNRQQHARGAVAGDPQVLVDAEIPPGMRALEPGVHELIVGSRTLHVFIREQAGHRFAVIDDESDFERLEGLLWAALGGAATLCLVLALLLGSATARHVIRPLSELAASVTGNRVGELTAMQRTDELGVLARALAASQQEMQHFLRREQYFTGDVSHELRTPLTIILGASEVLAASLRDRPDLLPAVDRIRRTATETADRVGALLMLSRSPDDLEFPSVELKGLLQTEVDRCRPLLQGKAVLLELRVEAAARGYGPPELMAIAVGNLIRNACQFTEAGSVCVTLQQNCMIVEDTGVGIPAEVRDQIFERFVSGGGAGGVGGSGAGSGLGLAIVRRVCECLGWTVTLEPRDSQGSRFTLCFPSCPPGAAGD